MPDSFDFAISSLSLCTSALRIRSATSGVLISTSITAFRPPGVRHPAHHLGCQDHRPGGRCIPGGRKIHGALHAVGIPAGGYFPDPDEENGWRPDCGPRNHDRYPGYPEPDPGRQDRPDVLVYPDRWLHWHADPGPVPGAFAAEGPHFSRTGPCQGQDAG